MLHLGVNIKWVGLRSLNRIIGFRLTGVLLLLCQSMLAQYPFQKLLLNAGAGGDIIRHSPDGDIVFTAWTYDHFGASGADVLLLSMNDQGDTLWTKVFSGPYDDGGTSLLTTADGGYLIVGSTRSSDPGPERVSMIKTDAWGDTLWTNVYAGAGNINVLSAIECTGGGFLLMGWYGGEGLYLIRTNAQGDLMWSKLYDRQDPPYYYSQIGPRSVVQTTDGNFLVAGRRSYSEGAFLSKVDTNGNVLWAKTTDDLYFHQLEQSPDGGLVILGESGSDYLLAKLDSLTNPLWAKRYGSSSTEWSYAILQNSEGGYTMTGMTPDAGFGTSDVYLIHTDSAGELLTSKTFGDSEWQAARDLTQTGDGSLFIVAWTATAAFGSCLYLIKTDPIGGVECFEDSVYTAAFDINFNWSDLELESFPCTTYQAPVTWTVGRGATIIPLCPVGLNDVGAGALEVEVFPNPASDRVIVSIPSSLNKPVLEVFDALGDRVHQARITYSTHTIDRGALPSGIYLIKVSSGHWYTFKKVVLE